MRLTGLAVLCLVLQACTTITARPDPERTLFASLFDVPRGSCRQLRAQLSEEIEGIRAAKKKAEDDMIAESEAPSKSPKPSWPRKKEDPLASLRDWQKRSEEAEKINTALKERHCRTVDIEAATK